MSAIPNPGSQVHPGVLAAVTSGINSLFGQGGQGGQGAIPNPAPAPMSDGGVVEPPRPDQNLGSTGQTFEPRLAMDHGGHMPNWQGAMRSTAGGDGGAGAAPGDHIHPPGDTNADTQILTMAMGGGVGEEIQRSITQAGANTRANDAADREAIEFKQKQKDRADAKLNEADVADTISPLEDATNDLPKDVDAVAEHLHSHMLGDNGQPAGSQAVPTPDGVAPSPGGAPPPAGGIPPAATGGAPPPADGIPPAATGGAPPTPADSATVSAVQSASGPAGQTPQQSPAQAGKPHSVSPDFYDESDRKILKATRSAILAGKDGKEVYEHLIAMRNGFFQSNVLKNLSAANAAWLTGNSAAVEKALKNAYYYFPNGKELTVKHDASGGIVYQDPMQPQRQKMGPDGKPELDKNHNPVMEDNMIPVDAQHLNMLGQSIMDSTKVNGIITSARSAAATQKLEAAKAATEDAKAKADIINARANATNANSTSRGVAANIYLHTAKGALDESLANEHKEKTALLIEDAANGAVDQKLAYKAAEAGGREAQLQFQGGLETAPAFDSKGHLSMSPVAGKSTRNPVLMSDPMRLYKDDQTAQAAITGIAANISAANIGVIDPHSAPTVAAQIYSAQRHVATKAQPFKSHINPQTKKPEPDVMIHPDKKTASVWNPQTGEWQVVKLSPRIASSLSSGQDIGSEPAAGSTANEE